MKKSRKILFTTALATLMIAGTAASAVGIYYAINKSKTNKTKELHEALTSTSVVITPLAANNFLPSEYNIPQQDTYSPVFFKTLGINVPALQNEMMTDEITSVSLVNVNDEKGTADLRVTYRSKYKDTYLPLTGFLKKSDTIEGLEFTLNNDFQRAVPSYYADEINLQKLLKNVQVPENFARSQIKLSIPYMNDNASIFVLKVEYQNKVKSFTLRTDYNTEKLLKAIVANPIYSQARENLSVTEFMKEHNSLETLFEPIDTKTGKELLYNQDLIKINNFYSNDEALLVYKVGYNEKSIQHSVKNLYTDSQLMQSRLFDKISYTTPRAVKFHSASIESLNNSQNMSNEQKRVWLQKNGFYNIDDRLDLSKVLITSTTEGNVQLEYVPTLGKAEVRSRGSVLNSVQKTKQFSVKRFDASNPNGSLDDTLLQTLEDYRNEKPFIEAAPVADDDLVIKEEDSAQQVETKITQAFNKYYLSNMDKTIATLFNNIEASFLDAFIDYNLAKHASSTMSSEELFGKLLNAVDLRYEYSVENNHVSYILEITLINEEALGLDKVYFTSFDHEQRKITGSLSPGENVTFRYVSDDLFNKSITNDQPKNAPQARDASDLEEELELNIIPHRGQDGNLRPVFSDTKVMFITNSNSKHAHVLNGNNSRATTQLNGLVIVPEDIIDPNKEPQFVIDHYDQLHKIESVLQALGWSILADAVSTVIMGVVSGILALGASGSFLVGFSTAFLPAFITGAGLGGSALVLSIFSEVMFAVGILTILVAIGLTLALLIMKVPPIVLKYEHALDVSYNIPDVKWDTYVNGSSHIIQTANFKESISQSFKKQLNEQYAASVGSRSMVMSLVENIINEQNPELRTVQNTFATNLKTNPNVTENVKNLSGMVGMLSYGILSDSDLNKHLGWDKEEDKEKLEKSLRVLQAITTYDPVNISAALISGGIQQYKPKIMEKLYGLKDAISSSMLGASCEQLDELVMNKDNYTNGKIKTAIADLDSYINSTAFSDAYRLKANKFANLSEDDIDKNIKKAREAWNGGAPKDGIKYYYEQIADSLITWNDTDNIPTQDQLNKYAFDIDKKIIDAFMPAYLENKKVDNNPDKPAKPDEEKPNARAEETKPDEDDNRFTVQDHFENILFNSSLKKDAVMPLLAIIHKSDDINPDNKDLLTSFMRFAQYKNFKFEYLAKSEQEIKGLVKSGQIENNETIVPYHIGHAFEHDFCYQNLETEQFRSLLKFFYNGYELTDSNGTREYRLSELLTKVKLEPVSVPIFTVASDDTVTIQMNEDVAGNKDQPVHLRYDFKTDLTGNDNVVKKTNIHDIAEFINYDDINRKRKAPVIGVRDFMNPKSGAHTPTASVKATSKTLTTHSQTSVFFPHFAVNGRMIAKYDEEIGNYVLEPFTPPNALTEGRINFGVPYIHFNQTSIFDHNILSDSITYGASEFTGGIKGRLVPSNMYLLNEYKHMFDAFANPFYNVLAQPSKK